MNSQRPDASSKQTQPAAAAAPPVAPSPGPTNNFKGLAAFLKRWDDAEYARRTAAATPPKEALFKTSPLGNINAAGSPHCVTSTIFDRHHPLFIDSLEAGVRDLTVELIERLDCITYSSCEGHRSVRVPPVREFSYRKVGIVSRDEDEHQRLTEALDALVQTTNGADIAPTTVRMDVRRRVLTSEMEDRPCIELVFVSGTDDEEVYFRDVEAVSQTFLRALKDPGS
jgi:hypothetical protein